MVSQKVPRTPPCQILVSKTEDQSRLPGLYLSLRFAVKEETVVSRPRQTTLRTQLTNEPYFHQLNNAFSSAQKHSALVPLPHSLETLRLQLAMP